MRITALDIEGLDRQYNRYIRNCNSPHLQQLFLEVTQRCNLSCIFCGSKCNEHTVIEEVPLEEYKKLLCKIKKDFGTDVFIVLTGGEPLLRTDILDICDYIHELGFSWGMTTNGTLLTPEIAAKLCNAGMFSVSISLDGPKEIHNNLRQVSTSYDAAINGIKILDKCDYRPKIMVTSVINHQSIAYLDELWNIVKELPTDTWRIMNVEPIGSARDKDILFTKEDFITLFDFIEAKRRDQWPITYGCCHYLGDREGYLRNWYYLCNAGIHIASIMTNGDIGSCLDIERRPETIFGNIYKDDFTDVWYNGFKLYREGLYNKCDTCKNCSEVKYCRGDSIHSWNFDTNEPMICLKNLHSKGEIS